MDNRELNCKKNKFDFKCKKENALNSLFEVEHFLCNLKKVCNAVKRNYLKRIVKNILDNHKNLYSKSKDYIIIIRKSCLLEKYSILEENLIYLIEKIEKEKKNEEK